jgi:hypothetical protein
MQYLSGTHYDSFIWTVVNNIYNLFLLEKIKFCIVHERQSTHFPEAKTHIVKHIL